MTPACWKNCYNIPAKLLLDRAPSTVGRRTRKQGWRRWRRGGRTTGSRRRRTRWPRSLTCPQGSREAGQRSRQGRQKQSMSPLGCQGVGPRPPNKISRVLSMIKISHAYAWSTKYDIAVWSVSNKLTEFIKKMHRVPFLSRNQKFWCWTSLVWCIAELGYFTFYPFSCACSLDSIAVSAFVVFWLTLTNPDSETSMLFYCSLPRCYFVLHYHIF